MTVSSTQARKTFAGDGVTTAFGTSPIVFFDNEDINVYVTVEATGVTTTLTEGTHYTLSGGDGAAGTVSLAGGASPWGALATGSTLIIERDVADTQEFDPEQNDGSDAEALEDAIDRRTMASQHTRTLIDRALRQPSGDSVLIAALPPRAERISKALAFDSDGDPVAVNLESASGTSVTATGSTTARLLAERFAEVINVKDYGAVGNGSTDDTTAIQAAVTAAQGSECALYFPPGTYRITGTIAITGALRLYGESRYGTSFAWTDTTLNVFTVTTPNQVTFERFTFSGPASATAGAIITLTAGASAENAFSTIRDCTFTQGFTHVSTTKAAQFAIETCYFSQYVGYGVLVQNTNNVDSGDSHVSGCIFSTTQTNAEAIRQVSSGGLRIVNNKMYGGLRGYRMALASGAATSICVIEGNSIEAQTESAISAVTAGGGATFSQFSITGNQIAQVPVGINFNDSTAFLSIINIVGNEIALSASGTFGVALTNVSNFNVAGNIITGTGGTPVGVAVGASSTAGQIGVNKYTALTTNVSVNTSATTVTGNSPVLLGQSGLAVTAPADTTEDALATITIPAKQFGKNGTVRVRAMFTITNGADDKTLRFRYSTISGTAVFSQLFTTNGKVAVDFVMQGRNATNLQVSHAIVTTDTPGAIAPATVASAIDTTADTTLVITGQKETSGDTITLESYTAELIPSTT